MAEFSNRGADGPPGVDLRAMLDEAIAKIEPLLRSAAAAQSDQSPCSWCPICKAAAAVKGQDQDLFASIAAQGGALLNILKDAVGGLDHTGAPNHAAAETAAPDAGAPTAFTEIPVTIKP